MGEYYMKKPLILLGMISVLTSVGGQIDGAETTQQDPSSPSMNQMLKEAEPHRPPVDITRNKFFLQEFLNQHPLIVSRDFNEKLKKCVEGSKTLPSAPLVEGTKPALQPSGELQKNQEKYNKLLILNLMTVYQLPFKEGCFFSSNQAVEALKILGFEEGLTHALDPGKWRKFIVGYCELLPIQMENDNVTLHKYLKEANKLSRRFGLRIKEDVHSLLTVTTLINNIKASEQNKDASENGQDIHAKLMKSSYKADAGAKDREIIKKIVQEIVGPTKNLKRLEDFLGAIGSFDSFERVCKALHQGKGRSINPEDELAVSVCIIDKLQENPQADVTPEAFDIIDSILARGLNKALFDEIIIKNLLKAIMPRKQGFDHVLPDGMF